MRKGIKVKSEKQFNRMKKSSQIKYIKKISATANNRIKTIEKNGLSSQSFSYTIAKNYNEDFNRKGFGISKNASQEEINNTFNKLKYFLNADDSTSKGIEKNIRKQVKEDVANHLVDNNYLKNVNGKEKEYKQKALNDIANERLRVLENNKIDKFAYSQVKQYTKAMGYKETRFKKVDKKHERNNFEHLVNFLNAKSSTLKGLKDTYDKRIETFRNKGVDIPNGREKEFFDFLSSEQFKTLAMRADSNQVIKTFNEARKLGEEVNDINKAFQDFLTKNITFDVVQERLNVAEWKNGGLMK